MQLYVYCEVNDKVEKMSILYSNLITPSDPYLLRKPLRILREVVGKVRKRRKSLSSHCKNSRNPTRYFCAKIKKFKIIFFFGKRKPHKVLNTTSHKSERIESKAALWPCWISADNTTGIVSTILESPMLSRRS